MSSVVAQRLRNFLAANGGEADLLTVCQEAFAAQTSPALAKRLLEAALPAELQIVGDRVLWLAPSSPTDDIDSSEFIVVDLETTGTNPAFDEIIEFGAVFVKGGKILREEQLLIRPRGRISPFIQQLTGIDNEMVIDAPPFEEVAKRLHRLFAGAVPVAHNAEFDYGFLRHAFESAGLSDVGDGRLCTMRLARRFAPGRRYNLDALAQRLGIETANRHRALADAKITAHVLIELLRAARGEGIQSVSALRKARARSKGRGAETRFQVGPERVRAIPPGPGVYRFRDAAGEVIYVGKAKSLRSRLGSYFVGAPKGKVGRMLEEVRDFDYTVVGSELEALLEEAREIRLRRPKYNVAMRSLRKYGYLRWVRDEAYPILRFAKERGDERYESFGPFRLPAGGRMELKALREAFPLRNCRGAIVPDAAASPCIEHPLGRCGAPCASLQHERAYQETINRLRAFLQGEKAPLATLRAEILLAADREQFERAAALRDRYRALLGLHNAVRREGATANLGDHVVVLPAVEPGMVRLYLVRPGSCLATTRVSVDTPDCTFAVRALLRPQPGDLAGLEDSRIAEQWARRKPSLPLIRLANYSDETSLAQAVQAKIRETGRKTSASAPAPA